MQWFDRAPEKERALAVGVRRYRAVERKLSGTGQRPEWPDFIDQDGKLLTPQKIVAGTADKTAERKQAVVAAGCVAAVCRAEAQIVTNCCAHFPYRKRTFSFVLRVNEQWPRIVGPEGGWLVPSEFNECLEETP